MGLVIMMSWVQLWVISIGKSFTHMPVYNLALA